MCEEIFLEFFVAISEKVRIREFPSVKMPITSRSGASSISPALVAVFLSYHR